MIENYDKIKMNYKFDWLTDVLQEDIKALIDKNISGKLDKYLQKYLQKEDAEMHLEVVVKKNKQEKYEWSFRFNIDWESHLYHNNSPFKNIEDLVNHAFDHFKRDLSDK